MEKLGKFARWNARKTRFGGDAFDDIVGEAAKRLLRLETVWLLEQSAYDIFAGAIRSIAWNWKEPWDKKTKESFDKEKTGNEPNVKIEFVSIDHAESVASKTLTPEENVLAGERHKSAIKICERLFGDDDVALRMAKLMLDGVDGEELREAVGLSKKDYETKRKFLRRRMERLEGQSRL